MHLYFEEQVLRNQVAIMEVLRSSLSESKDKRKILLLTNRIESSKKLLDSGIHGPSNWPGVPW